jgi:hypothetical protein
VFHQRYQGLFSRFPGAGVAHDDRQPGIEVERHADILRVVPPGAIEAVECHDERDLAALEVVNRGEAIGQPPRVGKHYRAERPDGEFIPHEPEPFLPGCPEQVKHQVLAQADPPEVHRHGCRGLALDADRVVYPGAAFGQWFLGAQRFDLAYRSDERGLSDPEPAREQDLDRAMTAPGRGTTVVIAPVGHEGPP